MHHRFKTLRSFWKAVAVVPAAVFAAYWILFGWFVHISPLTYAELDLNGDGRVSFSEADYAASFGERVVEVKEQKCTEYFAYKDGLALKVVCPRQG
jgi:hypothetical protein